MNGYPIFQDEAYGLRVSAIMRQKPPALADRMERHVAAVRLPLFR
jgi:hypothetical protein